MVEGIGDDSVLFGKEGFKDTAVCIEAGGIKDRVFGPEIVGDGLFELFVNILTATDEAHGRHTETPGIHGFLCGLDKSGII